MSGCIKVHHGDRAGVTLQTMELCVESVDKQRGLGLFFRSPASGIDKTLWAAWCAESVLKQELHTDFTKNADTPTVIYKTQKNTNKQVHMCTKEMSHTIFTNDLDVLENTYLSFWEEVDQENTDTDRWQNKGKKNNMQCLSKVLSEPWNEFYKCVWTLPEWWAQLFQKILSFSVLTMMVV